LQQIHHVFIFANQTFKLGMRKTPIELFQQILQYLFDRSTRQPTLTAQGEQVLGYVKAILAASSRLDEDPPRLHLRQSDIQTRYAENADRTVPANPPVHPGAGKERAQVGLIEARDSYPMEIGSMRLPLQTAMGIYVAPGQHRHTQQQQIVGRRPYLAARGVRRALKISAKPQFTPAVQSWWKSSPVAASLKR
jgi:hypothetical protein